MTELLVILTLALLVIGPKKLPELARSLAKGLGEFRRASTEMRREFLEVADDVRIDPPAEQTPEQSKSAPESDPKSETEPGAEAETKSETKPETKSETKPETKPETGAESEPDPEEPDGTKSAAEPKGSKVG